jgi:hypothetical protein
MHDAAIAELGERSAGYQERLAGLARARREASADVADLTAGKGRASEHQAHADAHARHAAAVTNVTRLEELDDAAQLAALVLRIAPTIAQIEELAADVVAQVDSASSRVTTLSGKSATRSEFDDVRRAMEAAHAFAARAVPAALRLAGPLT